MLHQHFHMKLSTDTKDKNNLIVLQHRYRPQGGSYDWYWLYTPQGKQIRKTEVKF